MLQTGFLAPNLFKDFFLLAAFAGALPLVIYYKGLAHTPASVGTFCEMMQNIAALVVTWGVLGDALVPHQILAGLVLLVAVYRLNEAQQQVGAGEALPAAAEG
jgi:drug/metabolite transporter (DMT)-like permease